MKDGASQRLALLRGALVAAVFVAVVVRLLLAGTRTFSPHDETVYLDAATHLARHGPTGLRDLVASYLAEPRAWLYPPPIRWGHHLLAAAACGLGGARFESLVALSTLASVATVVLTALLARRVGGAAAGGLAVALLTTSPLWLHLGRRALADAPYAAAALAATWAFLEAVRADGRRTLLTVLAVALLALQLAMKEGGLLLLGALLLVQAARATREGPTALVRPAAMLAGAGLLAWLGFSLLAGSPWSYLRVAQAIQSAGPHNPYLQTYQAGPAWRYLVDAALLSPGLVLLAPISVFRLLRPRVTARPGRSSDDGSARAGGARARADVGAGLAAFVVVYLALLVAAGAAGMGYNARYLLPLDAPLRVLTGAWLAWWAVGAATPRGRFARHAGVLLAVALDAGYQAFVFRRVFLEHHVYDPVSDALLKALGLAG